MRKCWPNTVACNLWDTKWANRVFTKAVKFDPANSQKPIFHTCRWRISQPFWSYSQFCEIILKNRFALTRPTWDFLANFKIDFTCKLGNLVLCQILAYNLDRALLAPDPIPKLKLLMSFEHCTVKNIGGIIYILYYIFIRLSVGHDCTTLAMVRDFPTSEIKSWGTTVYPKLPKIAANWLLSTFLEKSLLSKIMISKLWPWFCNRNIILKIMIDFFSKIIIFWLQNYDFPLKPDHNFQNYGFALKPDHNFQNYDRVFFKNHNFLSSKLWFSFETRS